MTPVYEVIKTDFGNTVIKRTDENGFETWIPTDPANSDYQRYLNPEAEQSTLIVTLPSNSSIPQAGE
jgi:hypothetical protein